MLDATALQIKWGLGIVADQMRIPFGSMNFTASGSVISQRRNADRIGGRSRFLLRRLREVIGCR